MKRALLAGVAACALSFGAAPQARAQGGLVHDPVHMLEAVMQWKAQHDAMAAELRQHVRLYESIVHQNSVGGVVGAIQGAARNMMAGRGELAPVMRGRHEWGAAGGHLMEDRLYVPPEMDEWAVEMERRERVTSNAKALAEAATEDALDQLEALDAIRAELEAAPDGTAVAAQQGAIAIAQQRLNTHRAQAEQVRLMMAADDRVTRQREEQRWRRDVDDWARKAAAAGGGW